MLILITLLEIVVPVFLIIAAGYLTVRIGFIPDAAIDPLVKFQVAAGVPCLLFVSMLRTDLATAINPWTLLAFFTSGTIVFLLAILLARRFWNRRPGEAVAVGFCAFFPNAVMLGIPITERAFGEPALAAVFGIIAFHSMYNWFVGFIAMEAVRRDSESIAVGVARAFTTTFQNPLMVGLMLGILWNILSLPLPRVALDAIDMMAGAAIPVALFALGGVLTRYRLLDKISEASMVTVITLVVHPAIAWVLTDLVFGLPLPFVQACVVITAMPTGINSYIFASLYNRAVGTAASSVLLSTAVSVATITGWLAFLGSG